MKYIVIVFFAIISSLSSASAHANVVTFEKEYTYQASEFDSKASSRILALEQVKRLLLEQLGTYLISETEVKNYQISKDQITILTAGIVRTEVIDEKWDGKTYYLKAKLSVDPNEVAQSVQKMAQDKKVIKELEETKKHADDLEKEIVRLRVELTAKTDGGKIEQYKDTVNKLSATEWEQKGDALLGYNENRGKNHEQNVEALKAYDKALELNPENPKLYFVRAYVLYMYDNSKDYASILADLDKAIELHPEANYHNMKAKIYKDKGEWRQVVQELETAITLEPLYALDYYHDISSETKSDKDWSDKDFDTIIKKYPKDYRAYVLRGYFYKLHTSLSGYLLSPKYYDLAIADYKKAIGLNSKLPLIYYLLASAYADKAAWCSSLSLEDFKLNYQMAADNASKAIELNASYLSAYRLRSIVYADLKEFKKAISDYNRILEFDPESGTTYYNLGQAYLELGQFDNAVQSFTSAMNAKNHTIGLPYLNYQKRAEAYIKAGELDKSLEDYTKAIELQAVRVKETDSHSGAFLLSGLYQGRGEVYALLGDLNLPVANARNASFSPRELPEYQNAISDFTQAIKLNSKSGAYEERSRVYTAIQDYQHALQDIDTSLRLYQEYEVNPGQVYLQRAYIYSYIGNINQAISDFSQAIKYSEGNLGLLYTQRGSAYLSLDDNTAAIRDFSEAIRQSPKFTDAFANRGVAYYNSGNYKAALSDFDKAVTLAPEQGIAYYNRGLARINLDDQKQGIEDFKIAARLGYKEAQDKLRALNIEW